MKKSHINGVRWFSRILGSLILLLVLFMAIGEALFMEPPPGSSGKLKESDIPLMTGMIVMLVGIVVAWFREEIGGLLMIGGFIPFLVDELKSERGFNAWFLVIFPIIGFLHLFCWWQSRRSEPKEV
jgi:uncharacterized membrane protein YkvI